MKYLLAWVMIVAKNLLRRTSIGMGEVAERAGYRSASAFSAELSRHMGLPPSSYARRGAP